MPLLVNNLISQLQNVLSADNSVSDSANKIASAYQSYISTALSPSGAPLLLTGNEVTVLQQYLVQAFSQTVPSVTAQLIGTGITSFWLMPPVPSGSGGVCSAIITSGGQASLLSSNASTRQQGAVNFANALHQMTITLFIVESPPFSPGIVI